MLNKKVILTLLITSIASFIIGFFFFEPDSEDLREQMFAYKVHANKKYDLVVAGDSRIYRGISTDIIGTQLGKTSINLGFSSGGYSEAMFDLIDKKLHKKNGNIIILGVSPLSLTNQAIENGHIRRLNALKSEEIIEYLYLNEYINIFATTTPRLLWNAIIHNEENNDNYIQKVNIKEGWVKSDYIIPYQNEALKSYNKTFTGTKISKQTINNLFAQIRKWIDHDFLVYGFVPPSSSNMEELERQYSDFNDREFAMGFIEAGGKWITFDETYTSYDGSHLDSKSAINLSTEIANAITNKTYLSDLSDSCQIKTNYYQFESKYTFQNDFENDTINILESDIAYSGNKVLVCDQNKEYLSLLQANMNNIINTKTNKVLIDMFVYFENEQTSARLIFDLKQNGKTTAWKGLALNKIVKPGNWGHIVFEFDIPENVTSEDELKIYIQNMNRTEILVDEFSLNLYLD